MPRVLFPDAWWFVRDALLLVGGLGLFVLLILISFLCGRDRPTGRCMRENRESSKRENYLFIEARSINEMLV